MTEIFGYQPRLRNSIVFTQESSSGTTTDSTQEVESKQETDTKPKQETYTKPAQKIVQAKAVSRPTKPTTTASITISPVSKKGIAMGYVETAYAAVGSKLLVQVRGRMLQAEVVKMPFRKGDPNKTA